MLRMASAVVVATCLVLSSPAGAQPVLSASQDPAAGARVFDAKGCVKCHAINGVGGKVGPDLARTVRPRSFYDLGAALWNHLQHMTDRMKQLGITRPVLEPREMSDLIGFLYTLGYFDRPGDPEHGKRLFTEKRCASCHVSGPGPSLEHLKQFASPIFVAAAMWNHGPQMAEVMKARGVERPTFTAAELADLIAFLAPATGRRDEGPVYVLPGRPEQGRLLFAEKRCVTCHSVGGAGGAVGPSLTDRGVRRSPLEFAAAIWNKAPAMQAALKPDMPRLPQLGPQEMADIVAYLYSSGYFAEPGNPSRGWKVMVDKGCLLCHAVYGERGKPASDLTRARGMDSPAGVIASLWNHVVVPPPAPGGGRARWPLFRSQEMADLVALMQGIRRHEP